MSLLALALAAEIGAKAPESLKPCAAPVIEKQAGHGLYTHLRRIKTDCGEIRPLLSVLFPKEAPIDYSTPYGSSFEALLQAVPDEAQAVSTEATSPRGDEATGRGPIDMVGMDARLFVAIPAVPEPALIYTLAVGLLALVWRRTGSQQQSPRLSTGESWADAENSRT